MLLPLRLLDVSKIKSLGAKTEKGHEQNIKAFWLSSSGLNNN